MLCRKKKKNMKWLQKYDNQFVWLKQRGIPDVLFTIQNIF